MANDKVRCWWCGATPTVTGYGQLLVDPATGERRVVVEMRRACKEHVGDAIELMQMNEDPDPADAAEDTGDGPGPSEA